MRLAIQCAIDRKQVLDTAALGEGEVTGPVTSPAYKSDPSSRPCPNRDLAKAADYLAKAGKSSVTIKTIVSQGEYATSVNEAQNLKAQLAEAKINLDLQVLESGAYVDRWVAADFDAAVALNGGRPDPDGMYGRYFTSTGNLNKVAGYSSPELDALFAQGKATSDTAARKADLRRRCPTQLEDNAAWIWMFTSYTYTVTTPGVQGFVPMANGSLQYLRTTTVSTVVIRAILGNGVVRTVGGALLTLLGVAVLVFVMLRAIPGDQITANLGTEAAAPDAGAAGGARSYYGLDQPLVVQFFSWLGNVLTGNLGYSARNQASVLELTASSLPDHPRAGRPVDRARAGDRRPAGDALGIQAELASGTAPARWSASRALSIPAFLLGSLLLSVFASRFGYNPNGRALRRSLQTRR